MSEFISLYSGSSGNCSVVRTGEKYIIIDMGKGVRTTSAALKELGLNISDCAGILVTHEHSDHVKGLATFLKKNPLPVYGADDTLDFLDANGIVPASCELRTLSGGEEDVGDFGVTMFPTSHDVPCVGYRIHTPDNKTMTIATDLGVLTPPVHQALSGCDLVALESNYDLHMLRSGRYPYYLRSRIESNRGHLSGDQRFQNRLVIGQQVQFRLWILFRSIRRLHGALDSGNTGMGKFLFTLYHLSGFGLDGCFILGLRGALFRFLFRRQPRLRIRT